MSKRLWVMPILYIQSINWMLQAVFVGGILQSSCLGAPRDACTGCLHLPCVDSIVAPACRAEGCSPAVYGTWVVARVQPTCWHGKERSDVLHTTQAAVISTWLFSFVLWCAQAPFSREKGLWGCQQV